jgi:hypothetical protein
VNEGAAIVALALLTGAMLGLLGVVVAVLARPLRPVSARRRARLATYGHVDPRRDLWRCRCSFQPLVDTGRPPHRSSRRGTGMGWSRLHLQGGELEVLPCGSDALAARVRQFDEERFALEGVLAVRRFGPLVQWSVALLLPEGRVVMIGWGPRVLRFFTEWNGARLVRRAPRRVLNIRRARRLALFE